MLLMLLLQTMTTNDDAHKVNIKAGSIDLENTFHQLTNVTNATLADYDNKLRRYGIKVRA